MEHLQDNYPPSPRHLAALMEQDSVRKDRGIFLVRRSALGERICVLFASWIEFLLLDCFLFFLPSSICILIQRYRRIFTEENVSCFDNYRFFYFYFFRQVPAFLYRMRCALPLAWVGVIAFLLSSYFFIFFFYLLPSYVHEYALGFGLWNRLVRCIPRILESQNRIQSINLLRLSTLQVVLRSSRHYNRNSVLPTSKHPY